ncbi:hypothetical protein [Bradyrhizobium murdochi]|nr:hypothetical protein [Bradyrhizobium murdochi]
MTLVVIPAIYPTSRRRRPASLIEAPFGIVLQVLARRVSIDAAIAAKH